MPLKNYTITTGVVDCLILRTSYRKAAPESDGQGQGSEMRFWLAMNDRNRDDCPN